MTLVHDVNFDSDIPSINGRHLRRLVEKFLEEGLRNKQAKTVKGYSYRFLAFFEWWEEVGPHQDWVLTSDDLAAFVKDMADSNLPYNKRHEAVKRLRQAFKWAHRRGMLPVDFGLFLPNVKGGMPERRAVSLSALEAMLEACWQLADPIHNRAIIAVLAGTGLRLEECTSLTIECIEMLPEGGFVTPRVTKFDKPRTVVFDAATATYLQKWLDVLGKKEGPLWPSRTGKKANPLSTDGIYKVIYDVAAITGIHCSPHDLRRMFATIFLKTHRGEGYAKLLQKQMGHSHFSTTAIYALPGLDDIHEVMTDGAVSPMAKLLQKAKQRQELITNTPVPIIEEPVYVPSQPAAPQDPTASYRWLSDLPGLITEFLASKAANNRRDVTLSLNQWHLGNFVKWCASQGLTAPSLVGIAGAKTIETYIQWMADNDYSISTISQRYRMIQQLYRWLEHHFGFIEAGNPIDLINFSDVLVKAPATP